MTEEERHKRLQEAQDKAYEYANMAEEFGISGYIDTANMWANVARALRKDRV